MIASYNGLGWERVAWERMGCLRENGLPERERVAWERSGCLRENGLPKREGVARERTGCPRENGLTQKRVDLRVEGCPERGLTWERVELRRVSPEKWLILERVDLRNGWPEKGLTWERVDLRKDFRLLPGYFKLLAFNLELQNSQLLIWSLKFWKTIIEYQRQL